MIAYASPALPVMDDPYLLEPPGPPNLPPNVTPLVVAAAPATVTRKPRLPRLPRLRAGTVNYLDGELRDYRQTRRLLTETERDICEADLGIDYSQRIAPAAGRGPTRYSDPTGQKATRLAEYRLLRKMREVVHAVDSLLADLPPDQRTALVLLYWQRSEYGTTKRVAEAVHVAERTVRTWRDAWRLVLAQRLGLY